VKSRANSSCFTSPHPKIARLATALMFVLNKRAKEKLMEKTRPSLTKDEALAEKMVKSETGYNWAAISNIFGA